MPHNTHRPFEPILPVVDLIVPARNEQDNIGALLKVLPRDQLRHVVVVDNGSTDQTASLAKQGGAVVVSQLQRGYGAACLAGLAWLSDLARPPEVVAFLDADLADDPAMLQRVCQPIADNQADLVIASRHRFAQPGALTPLQRFGNRLSCALIRLCTGASFSDLGPMRAVRWSSLQRLSMSDQTWGWTVEMQFKAAAHRLRTREVDVVYRCRRAGQSKISGTIVGSVKAGWKIITTIAVLAWRHRWQLLDRRQARPAPARGTDLVTVKDS